MSIIRIFLGNRNSIFRQGIRSCLLEKRDYVVVGEASTKQQIFMSCQKLKPEVLTLDADDDCVSAQELFKSLRSSFSGIKLFFFVNTREEKICKRLLRLNADAYLCYEDTKPDIYKAIEEVASGKYYVSQRLKSLVLNSFLPGKTKKVYLSLTKREKEILKLIADEFVTSEIAESLYISKHTVETHRKRLLSKLNARNTAGLVKHAVEQGLVS